ncbi:MAG: lipid-binding SYLF domain-containing protein [Proteobacteria bacterium]|nr:lipid-binding SYLF domain-containing protein [Pseudomonadota bacterium]
MRALSLRLRLRFRLGALLPALMILSGIGLVLSPGAVAGQAEDAQRLVDKARITVDAFRDDPNMAALRALAKDAKALFIVPQLIKGGFIFAGEGGTGVLLTREGGWSAPAFYTMAAGSIGFQIGGQTSEVVLVLMTDRALDAVLQNKVKLGADVGVAAGPLGGGVETAIATNLRADIYTYAKSKGLFAGISFEGAVITERGKLNRAYYGRRVSPEDIVIRRTVDNPNANRLRTSLDGLIAR